MPWRIAFGALLALAAPAVHADTIVNGYLFISDYGDSSLDRYLYTYDQTTNKITAITAYGINGNTTNAFFLGGTLNPVKEGVEGTLDDLIIVGGNHGTGVTNITRYTLNGQLIGSIPIDFSSYNGGNVGIGNIVITPDGNYLYAPLEGANAIVKISLYTGAIVASYSFTGAHDVTLLPDGSIIAANYAATGASVILLDANLGFKQTLLTQATAGAGSSFRPSGLTYVASSGSLYVENNVAGGPDSVLDYTLSGSPGTMSASLNTGRSYIGSGTLNALEFTFGNNLGPDGNLYVAALGGGGAGSFSVKSGYTDGIYQLNTGTDALTLSIAGYVEPSGPAGGTGLVAPKYLQFSSNFITVNDPGNPLPEPGTTALFALAAAGLAAARHRRVKPV